jgi:uncharacterized protein (TIGR02453 family)
METTIIDFLKELEKNNNREWFQANKAWYEEGKKEFEDFINSLIPAVAKYDDSIKFLTAKDCIWRIYRDVRFAKDKSPYKTNFGAFMAKGGKKNHGPGYYFHIQPGDCFLTGGVWMPESEVTKKIRKEIYYNYDEFTGILNAKEFKKYFNGIDEWDRQKLPPRDFPKDFPGMNLLLNKSFTVSHALPEKTLYSDGLLDFAVKVYKAMGPYNAFLGRAIEG